ncbi:MAG TPA: hypothetical protein VGL93_23085 [Streptosporangiaceae bacterium]|jgi:hypothetical protein
MKAARIIATLAFAGGITAIAGTAHAATAGGAVPATGERAVVVLPGAAQLPTAVWLPMPRGSYGTAARTTTPDASGDRFTKASARTPEPGLSGGSLVSLTTGALTAAAASLLVATRRHRPRRG